MTAPTPGFSDENPDAYDADVQLANSMLVMREICRIQFLEEFEKNLAPGIAKALIKHGVKFP